VILKIAFLKFSKNQVTRTPEFTSPQCFCHWNRGYPW